MRHDKYSGGLTMAHLRQWRTCARAPKIRGPQMENFVWSCSLHGIGTGEKKQLGPSGEENIVHKMDFTDMIDLFTAAKTSFKCFVLRTYLQFCISFSSISGPKILLLSFQFDKNTPFPIFAFSNVTYEYKAKVSSRTRGPLISLVRQGSCGLNPALDKPA